jgi:hypothetical protein
MARLANIKSGGFTAGTAAVLTFDADDTDTPNKDESAEVEGTYNDAEGTYTCTGSSDCTVTLNAKGAITRISAGWTFFPAAGAKSDVPDDDYLYYGFWLKKTTKDNVTTYNEVQTFARSKAPVFTATEMTNVMGTANYKGDATGVYVHENNPLGGGDPESATSGHFTAGVELTAYFNGDDVAENKKLSISGAVSDFQLSGGQENSWEVTLGQADFRTGENANAFGDLNADGGGGLAAWGGRFYGAVEDDPDDDADVKLAPDIVTGEFNANFPNGSAAGAFGARKQDE